MTRRGFLTSAVANITDRYDDLAHPDEVLRRIAWDAYRLELRAFVGDLLLYVAVGLDALVEYAYREANTSFAHGHDGGPWWAFLVEYGADVDASRAVAEAEDIVSGAWD